MKTFSDVGNIVVFLRACFWNKQKTHSWNVRRRSALRRTWYWMFTNTASFIEIHFCWNIKNVNQWRSWEMVRKRGKENDVFVQSIFSNNVHLTQQIIYMLIVFSWKLNYILMDWIDFLLPAWYSLARKWIVGFHWMQNEQPSQ